MSIVLRPSEPADLAEAAPAPAAESNEAAAARPPRVAPGTGVVLPLNILATIAVLAAVDYAQSLVLPVVLAIIMTLTLTPINLWLQKRIGGTISAFILVGSLAGVVTGAVVSLSGPVGTWIEDAPSIGARLSVRLSELREPVEAVSRASREVDRIAGAAGDDSVDEVVVRSPGLLTRAANNIGSIASTVVVALGLTFFLLATNRLTYEKIVRAAPRLSDKKRALGTVNNIVSVVSRYLLTVTLINACFGVLMGAVFWALGMPNPLLWAVIAFFLKYLPLIGPLVGTAAAGVVGLLHFPDLVPALAPAVVFFVLTAAEGHFVTPSVLGRRLELNPAAILLSIALWGFLWGVAGVILAVPILVITKVLCDNVEALRAFGVLLSGASSRPAEPDAEARADA